VMTALRYFPHEFAARMKPSSTEVKP